MYKKIIILPIEFPFISNEIIDVISATLSRSSETLSTFRRSEIHIDIFCQYSHLPIEWINYMWNKETFI